MRIVKRTSRPELRSLGHRMLQKSLRWHSPCGVGAVTRRCGFNQDTVCVPLMQMASGLRIDCLTPLMYKKDVYRQVRGLAIGSPWGGTGCRLWSQCCEHTSSAWRSYLRRSRGGVWCSPRWVDDRWSLVAARCVEDLHRVAGGESVQFCPGPYRFRLLLLSLCQWSFADQATHRTVRVLLKIASFLQGGVLQTEEDPSTFVGADTRIYVRTEQGWRLGSHRGICQDISVSTRMMTKSDDLLDATMPKTQSGRVRKPRLQHLRLDARTRRERGTSLVPWVVLLCDMMVVPSFVGDAARTTDPELTNLITEWERWAMQPVLGLLREMRRYEWPFTLFTDAVHMTKTKIRASPNDHRQKMLRWIERWTLFGMETEALRARLGS